MSYGLALIVLIAIVAIVVIWPLSKRSGGPTQAARLEELEAAKESKYREIRDAELDHGMGKLSDADFAAVDGELRGEAIEILRELDELQGRSPDGPAGGDRGQRAAR